ncbi:DUF397 domain-containing protein [Streptomyces sp. D2-8]|uniref:DUF397 domain-containing protein n=1 Tax=Streptomyces sp. D2-8 TaxID=2707767 RepID=UPI0020C16F2B|nr:DUF397 domain-containing protein [Streptomyces sp. D2-8]MCK8435463.1 DUF397 domain-containing protein [Streptomyces sp. D2-8]
MRTIDVSALTWRSSSYSNSDGGACLEVSDGVVGAIPVRDSKVAHGPVLVFPAGRWASFVTAVKGGSLPPVSRG